MKQMWWELLNQQYDEKSELMQKISGWNSIKLIGRVFTVNFTLYLLMSLTVFLIDQYQKDKEESEHKKEEAVKDIAALKKQLSQVEHQLKELKTKAVQKVMFLSNLPSTAPKPTGKPPLKSLFPQIGSGTSVPTKPGNQVSAVVVT